MSIGHLHPDDFDRHVASLLLTHEELDLCKDLQPIKLSRKIASLRKSAQLTEIFDRDDHVVPLSEISVTQLMLSNVDLPSFDIFDSIKWEDEDHE